MPKIRILVAGIIVSIVVCITLLVAMDKAPAEWAYDIYKMILAALLGSVATYYYAKTARD